MKRKTPGQVAYEAAKALSSYGFPAWDDANKFHHKAWEAAATAILADQWRPLPPVADPLAERIAKLESELSQLKADYEKAK